MSYTISPNNKILNISKSTTLFLSLLGVAFFALGYIGLSESLKNGWEYNPIVNVLLLIWMLFSAGVFLLGVRIFFMSPKDISVKVSKDK